MSRKKKPNHDPAVIWLDKAAGLKKGHEWYLTIPSKSTRWTCKKCGATRVSRDQPQPHILLVKPEHIALDTAFGLRGPQSGETGLTCEDLMIEGIYKS